MISPMRTLTYYVGTTLDGYIAAPDGAVDAFPVEQPILDFIAAEFPETLPTHGRDQLGVTASGTRFDTVVMGRSTYAPALDVGITSPYAHLRQYVVSTTLTPADPAVEIVADDPLGLVRELKREEGSGIWLAGGGRLAGALLPEIDELVVKLYPVVLGRGIPMIASERPLPSSFTLVESRALEGGTTVHTYRRSHGQPVPG
jgi:dihydrofolate reductase